MAKLRPLPESRHRALRPSTTVESAVITDPPLDQLHQQLMANCVEAALAIQVDHLVVAVGHPFANVVDRLLGASFRLESVQSRPEARFKQRFDHDLHRRLCDPVFHRWNAQRPLPAAARWIGAPTITCTRAVAGMPTHSSRRCSRAAWGGVAAAGWRWRSMKPSSRKAVAAWPGPRGSATRWGRRFRGTCSGACALCRRPAYSALLLAGLEAYGPHRGQAYDQLPKPGFPFWPWHGESIPPRCPEYHVFSR